MPLGVLFLSGNNHEDVQSGQDRVDRAATFPQDDDDDWQCVQRSESPFTIVDRCGTTRSFLRLIVPSFSFSLSFLHLAIEQTACPRGIQVGFQYLGSTFILSRLFDDFGGQLREAIPMDIEAKSLAMDDAQFFRSSNHFKHAITICQSLWAQKKEVPKSKREREKVERKRSTRQALFKGTRALGFIHGKGKETTFFVCTLIARPVGRGGGSFEV